jgi:hypothetical protein
MGLDMEMSCDELVLKNLGREIKKDYSMSLLSIAADRRVLRSAPLAFGENGVEKRVKNVLKSRKSSRIMVALSIAFVAVLSLGLMVSRAGAEDILINSGSSMNADYIITDYYTEDGTFSDLGLALDEMDSEKVLSVSGGDTLIVGDRKYEVSIESLALSFYTQPSIDQVIEWWTNYLDSWAESSKLTVVS